MRQFLFVMSQNSNLVNGQHWYGDFNTVTTTCRLSVGDPASCSNMPSGASYGTLEVQKYNDYITQTYISIKNNNTQWIRTSTNSGSSWSGWTKYATKDDINALPRHIEGNIPAKGSITIEFTRHSSALLTFCCSAGTGYASYLYQGYGIGSQRQHIVELATGTTYSYTIDESEQKITITSTFDGETKYSITTFLGPMPTVS